VAFASLQVPLRPCSHEPTLFVPPDIARFTKTGDLITTDELGDDLATTVSDRNAALNRQPRHHHLWCERP
jgi:hypothetical protein